MATFCIGGVPQAAYKYDWAGRQVIRALTSPTPVTMHSVFDSDGNRIAEYNEATGALIREYVWANAEPLAVIEGGVINYIRVDHIGRPVFATNRLRHQNLDSQLPPLRRSPHHHRHPHHPPFPRPVVPIRVRLAPELDAGL